ncbi:hypothetical protein PPYR_04559 [Photinus pyralis]|uniref:GDNF/GAS1 domain-containing protein n=1 Tax=Photinus pyralis TaxID=7054 RepID=A0A1Y1N4K2_PHOPY|nr:growth arrest-specific protein 1-like [Photinus pyralis]KAB0802373.1 hypothetical protein PPYR_04559 [Photinus pyralis]
MWWVMMSVTAIVGVAAEYRAPISCEEARLKCAYRVGCGKALQNYMVGCSAVLQGPESPSCPENCQHALIALTSTEEGRDLMKCECSDDFCEDAKRRVEVCRPQVLKATRNESVVSCRVAQWICSADALCSTALDYYNRYCRSMFHGKKCTHRCLNSISILRRQEKASKLESCKCDGHEEYDCPQIQNNMARLCFHKNINQVTPEPVGDIETNNIIRDTRTSVGVCGVIRTSLFLILVLNTLTFAVT